FRCRYFPPSFRLMWSPVQIVKCFYMKQKLIRSLEAYIKDKDRKPYLRTAFELALCLAVERGVMHYFNHLLYKRGCRDILNYISLKKIRRIQIELFKSKKALNPILCDKVLFQQFLKENSLPGPREIGTIK